MPSGTGTEFFTQTVWRRIVLQTSFLTKTPMSKYYINASCVSGVQEVSRHYILTQGPMENTTDHWQMVWEQQTVEIVMLCRCEEEKGQSDVFTESGEQKEDEKDFICSA